MNTLNQIKNLFNKITKRKADPIKNFDLFQKQWTEDIIKTMCDLTVRIEAAKRKHAR